MSKKITKKLLVLLFSILFLSIALFPDKVLITLIELKFSSLGKVTCQRVGFKHHTLCFSGVHLEEKGYYNLDIEEISYQKGHLFLEGVTLLLLKKSQGFSQKKIEQFFLNPRFETTVSSGKVILSDCTLPWSYDHGFKLFEGDDAIVVDLVAEGDETLLIRSRFHQKKLSLLTPLLRLCLPLNQKWHFSEGDVSLDSLALRFKKDRCQTACGRALFENVSGRVSEDVEMKLESMECDFSFALDSIENCNATCSLKQGTLCSHFLKGNWNVTLPQANVEIEQGTIKQGRCEASLLGMGATLVCQGSLSDFSVDVKASGMTENLSLPLLSSFPNESCALAAHIQKNKQGLFLSGALDLATHHFDIGCQFQREKDQPLGWFRANHLPLQHFLSPFFAKQTKLAFRGECDVEGTFDENTLFLYYGGTNLQILGENFALSWPKIEGEGGGFHHFQFKTGKSSGFLPLKGATYEQKNLGFTLENAQGIAYFNDQEITIKNIETHFKELYFRGEVALHLGKKSDLEIKASSFEGSFESANELLCHCLPAFSWKLPLSGYVQSREGFYLHYLFDGKANLLDAKMGGELCCHAENKLFSLTDFALSFAFDKSTEVIHFSQGAGTLLFPGKKETYTIETPFIDITHFPSFDLSLLCSVKKEGKRCFNCRCKTEKKGGKREVILEGDDFQIFGIQEDKNLNITQFHIGNYIGKGLIDFSNGGNILSEFEIASSDFGELKCRAVFEKLTHSFSASFPVLKLKSGQHFQLAPIRNCELIFDASAIVIHADYCLNGHFFPLTLFCKPHLQEGTILFKEKRSDVQGLKIEWKKENKFKITTILGSFLGIEAALFENEEKELTDHVSMTGRLGFNLSRMKQLFNASLQKAIEKFGFGEGYWLEGEFVIPPKNITDFYFSGTLHGKNFVMGSLRLSTLEGVVNYSPDRIEIRNLKMEDWGGKALIPRAEFTKTEGQWHFSIPEMRGEEIHLSRLKRLKNKKAFYKPFQIHQVLINNCFGILGDKESYQGCGELRFTHLSKKTFFSNLLFIPREITARLGLDLNLLVPAQGTIHYEIKEGKINLLKFKGVYSEGKRSRFYLQEGQPATIDFDGNLNLKVKMKQYNLLMKLAELFVITVKGTLFDPSYSFINIYEQNDFEKED